MLRSLRALLLFWTVFASYGAYWLVSRVVGPARRAALLDRVHRRNARRLARGFTQLRGVFIKMGQVLSVVGTFLPRAYADELEQLQDKVPPRPFRDIEPRLQEALGDNALGQFAEFDQNAIAAASLAQVHRAVTRDGRTVAVKVLYPGIAELIRRDLGVLRSILPIVRRIVPVNRVERVLEQLSAMLDRETNYAHERANMERLRTIFADNPRVVIPQIVPELTAAGVLTMSYETGHKINDRAALAAAGIDCEAVGKLLVECYFEMLLRRRVFHADPHPGNFFVRPGPTLVMLDFGAVEQVTDALAEGMKTVVLGAIMRDDEAILRGIERMGFVAAAGDRQLLGRVGRQYLKVLASVRIDDYSKMNFSAVEKLVGFQEARGHLREIMKSVEYPEGFFYVERTLVLLFGLVAQLAPSAGLPGLALPYASRALAGSFVPTAAPPTRAAES